MNAQLLLSPLAALLLAPLFLGIVNRTKAFFAGRKGPPLLQVYYDISRLFHKTPVYSKSTSWIFRAAPVILFAATLAATSFIPVFRTGTFALFPADLVLLLYLLALARFFLILSALDTASSFEGMGASREAFFSALAEPVLFLCLLNVLRAHGTASITAALSSPTASDPVPLLLTAIALFAVLLAENSRIPVDDPTTHLELTMIHEVMILDNSGPGLALMEYAAAIKLWLFSVILAGVVLPLLHCPQLLHPVIVIALTVIIAITIGVVESVTARLRLIKVPQLLFGAGVAALMGFLISTTGGLMR